MAVPDTNFKANVNRWNIEGLSRHLAKDHSLLSGRTRHFYKDPYHNAAIRFFWKGGSGIYLGGGCLLAATNRPPPSKTSVLLQRSLSSCRNQVSPKKGRVEGKTSMVIAVSAGGYHNQVPLESLASNVKKEFLFLTFH